ncbi:MAG TPA: ABC transporter permease subunit [Tabrizicola sp.]|jgi:general L-amino acid transport system permease protein|nr:ABC transporter permease subunit [Tabrizicola sp.]
MAMATDAPKDGFRLSMLVYDTRYRSYTIQVVVLVLFAMAVAWLLNNTAQNLAARGKEFNFGFLWQRAGYDIGQQLIPYTNDSTHFRALLVGLINTLVVAFVGCIFATILGVLIGVLRLSKNWLVSRLMTVYVEMFRNVPLLLWILLSYVLLSETTPAPNAFKPKASGEAPDASMMLWDSMAVTNRGTNVALPIAGWELWTVLAVLVGSLVTAWFVNRTSVRRLQEEGVDPVSGWTILAIAVLPTLAVFVIGAGWMFAVGFLARLALLGLVLIGVWTALRVATAAFPVFLGQIVRVVGVVVLGGIWLFMIGPVLWTTVFDSLNLDPSFQSFVPMEVPVLKGFNFQGGILVAHSFTAMVVALTLYTAAFIAEIVRAGIQAISRGQSEAAFALGLRPGRTMNLIILPQALRVIIPPLISQYLNLTKNTSLGIAVSYLDLRGTLGGITLNQTGRELECMLLMMLIYLTISLTISALMNMYNRSVQLKAR